MGRPLPQLVLVLNQSAVLLVLLLEILAAVVLLIFFFYDRIIMRFIIGMHGTNSIIVFSRPSEKTTFQ